jgi:hypothetical protein
MGIELKQLAVGLSGSHFDEMVIRLAMQFAERTHASIDAYLIRPVPDDPQLLMASGFLGETFKTFFEEAEKTISAFDGTARASFDAVKSAFPNVKASYHNPLKGLAREFTTAVWSADLAIMAHPALVNLHYYKNAVLDTIADSARPVLLLPEEKCLGDFKQVLMLWRADTHHAQALTAALPMLALADQVTIVSRDDEESLHRGGAVAMQYLTAHGVNAQAVTINTKTRLTPKTIETLCDEYDISLLVISGGMQSDLIDSFVTGTGRRASKKPSRALLAIG